jgi:predicted lactoylglutathione lyase
MTAMRSITVSLPVRNLKVSAAFFAELGFTVSPERSGPGTVCLVIDQNISVLLMPAEHYRDRVNGDASCTGSGGEALLCLSADSEREVDETVMKAVIAGGRPWPLAADQRPVYSGSFLDPDGHLWQVTCSRERARQEPGMTARSRREPGHQMPAGTLSAATTVQP